MSGSNDEAARFLKGRHGLVSFAVQQNMPIVADLCQSFALDNGAYSSWRRGLSVNWKDYHEWVQEWCLHPGFDFAIIPDVIDGDEGANDALVSEFEAAGLSRYGCPVWHLHESLDRLVALAHSWPRVALGSSGQWSTPGTPNWWLRMADAMKAVCDRQGRPCTKLHGLRMLNPQVFSMLPLASADSTNVAVNSGSLARFGMYLPPSASVRAAVIADRIEAFNSAPVWKSFEQGKLFDESRIPRAGGEL